MNCFFRSLLGKPPLPQILTYQLSLSQPEKADYAHQITTSSSYFGQRSTLRNVWLWTNLNRLLYHQSHSEVQLWLILQPVLMHLQQSICYHNMPWSRLADLPHLAMFRSWKSHTQQQKQVHLEFWNQNPHLISHCYFIIFYVTWKNKHFLIFPSSLSRYSSAPKTKRIFQMLWCISEGRTKRARPSQPFLKNCQNGAF